MPKTYFEYRGVENAVYAEVIKDDSTGITFGPVKEFVGLSEVGKTTDSANEAHYYDNLPAIVVSSTGADEISLNTAGIPFNVLADITGQYYDETIGMLVEKERTPKYFALGYVTDKTDGTKVLVWRLKGTFTVPEQTSATKDDGTDANGQTLTYTGISTAYKFESLVNSNGDKQPAKAINIDTSVNTAMSVDTFFSAVQTPDTITPSTVPVTGVTLTPDTATVAVDATTTLTVNITPENATNKSVTWSSSNDEIATVSNGVVTGVSAGEATITVTTVDGSFTDTCTVTVQSA